MQAADLLATPEKKYLLKTELFKTLGFVSNRKYLCEDRSSGRQIFGGVPTNKFSKVLERHCYFLHVIYFNRFTVMVTH